MFVFKQRAAYSGQKRGSDCHPLPLVPLRRLSWAAMTWALTCCWVFCWMLRAAPQSYFLELLFLKVFSQTRSWNIQGKGEGGVQKPSWGPVAMLLLHVLCYTNHPLKPAEERLWGVHGESQVEERSTGIAEVPDSICHTGIAQKMMLWQSCSALEQITCREAQKVPKAQELTCPLLVSKDSKQQRLWSRQGRWLRCRVSRNFSPSRG